MINQATQVELRNCANCRRPAKYQCPRCSAFTCALSCYRLHGQSCIEKFASQSFANSLKGLRSDPEQRKKAAKFLKRYWEEQQQEKEQLEDEQLGQKQDQRLEQLLRKGELQLNSLTNEQLLSFQKYIQQSRLKGWIPFWQIDESIELYILNEPQKPNKYKFRSVARFRTKMKQHLCSLPPVSKMRKNISPGFRFIFLRALLAAVVAFRYFNGDFGDPELMPYFQGLSEFRSLRKEYRSAQEVVQDLLPAAGSWLMLALSDCSNILSSKFKRAQIFFKLYQLAGQEEVKHKLIFFMAYGRDIQQHQLIRELDSAQTSFAL